MFGSIVSVSCLASPTQDGKKHPEMRKKVKVRKKILDVKNFFLKKKKKRKISPKNENLCLGGGQAAPVVDMLDF